MPVTVASSKKSRNATEAIASPNLEDQYQSAPCPGPEPASLTGSLLKDAPDYLVGVHSEATA